MKVGGIGTCLSRAFLSRLNKRKGHGEAGEVKVQNRNTSISDFFIIVIIKILLEIRTTAIAFESRLQFLILIGYIENLAKQL